ncbi:hypothetical protein [Cellulomonas hominis]|uniref:hypothetical protein n=1 Tax=Cellulomonas hominis TaxID=156981 RepID=UPI001B94F984|nr:hypothetical protein [Cellulomonas hominis]VTR76035.1 hypothetical protein CHMI_00791 [Cellulomonas hominis]
MNERTERFRDAGGGTPMWWAAGGFLVVVVLALVAVLVLTREPPAEDRPEFGAGSQADPDSSTAATPAPAEREGGSCPLPADNQDIPVAGPEATWVAYGYVFVPQSQVYGPVTEGGRQWGCFAHNPTGALFAAANLFAEIGEPDYALVVGEALVDNPAGTAWLEEQDTSNRTQTAGQVGQIAGFQFLSVTEDQVVVSLGMSHDPVEAAVKIALQWDEDTATWRGDLAAGTFDWSAVDLDTYTPWSASGE